MYTKNYFKNKLMRRRDDLVALIHGLEDQLDDPKNPDVEERSVEREGDEVMELQVKYGYDEIEAINAALSRLKNDTYGVCLSCKEPISDERLDAVPHAFLCRYCMVEDQSK